MIHSRTSMFYSLVWSCAVLSGFGVRGQAAAAEEVNRHFEKVVVVFLENQGFDAAMAQPFFKTLVAKGGLLSQFYAETHPSQPNYIAMTSGTTAGVTGDMNVDLSRKHLGDLLDAKGLSWRNYAEALPSKCYTGARSGTYARKHVPFISYTNVSQNPARCSQIVSANSFTADAKNGQLPEFSFYSPDMNNDGHDTGVAYAARAMEKTFGPLLADQNVMSTTLFVFTFDEDDGGNGNRIYTVFVGAGVQPGSTSSTRYTHYDLLRTIEDEFGLGNLGQADAKAKSITGIWSNSL